MRQKRLILGHSDGLADDVGRYAAHVSHKCVSKSIGERREIWHTCISSRPTRWRGSVGSETPWADCVGAIRPIDLLV